MSLWGNNSSDANNAPMYKILDNNHANGQVLYGNTEPGAFVTNMVTDVVGIKASNTTLGPTGFSAGWNLVRVGMGPLLSVSVNAPGHSYSNGDTLTIYDANSTAPNAVYTVVTNASGNLASFTLNTAGGPFTGNSNYTTVAWANSTGGTEGGTGGTVTMVFGGRADRAPAEVLVALRTQ